MERQPCIFIQTHYSITDTVVIRYNTIGGVHKYESCYNPIVLYEMARFYLVQVGMTGDTRDAVI